MGIEVRRRTGYVPEVPTLYDWMTVSEIGWFASGFHPDESQSRAGYQVAYAELTAVSNCPRTARSRPYQKGCEPRFRCHWPCASNPRLLILDEPTSGLDVLVRREFMESMVDLAGGGQTVLLSSHQIGEVERVASHVVLLHKGKLILAEPLEDLKRDTFQFPLCSMVATMPKPRPKAEGSS